MPEKVNEKTIFSLSEVALSIQRTLADRYQNSFWVKAEMNKLNRYPHSGHCYPDLVEKFQGKIVAELRANIWRDDFDAINARFLEVLHEPLKEGITILFSAKITFHPVYGLSLRILDIDPVFSLGELEREKQETIALLRKEGIFGRNKLAFLPLLPQRIAIISVQTSKGYADFIKVTGENPWGYKIFHMLFPALLQGENAVESILNQLKFVERVKHHFDAVEIIRGGGGDIGLTCYNNDLLARTIALFPIPVITGIGHSTNETVSEMVAFKNAITPTELADFLIQHFHNFSVPVNRAREIIVAEAQGVIRHEKLKMLNLVRFFKAISMANAGNRRNELDRLTARLLGQSSHFLKFMKEKQVDQHLKILEKSVTTQIQEHRRSVTVSAGRLRSGVTVFTAGEKVRITQSEKLVEIMDPIHVLKRGYTITKINNRILKNVSDLSPGDQLQTILADGEITSITQSVTKNISHE